MADFGIDPNMFGRYVRDTQHYIYVASLIELYRVGVVEGYFTPDILHAALIADRINALIKDCEYLKIHRPAEHCTVFLNGGIYNNYENGDDDFGSYGD